MSGPQTRVVGHTPGPWHVGAQNDMLYIIAGRSPSLNNDYPFHDADRTPLARIYDEVVGFDVASANTLAMAAAPTLLSACWAAKEFLEPFLEEPGRTVFWHLCAAMKEATGSPAVRGRADIALIEGEPK